VDFWEMGICCCTLTEQWLLRAAVFDNDLFGDIRHIRFSLKKSLENVPRLFFEKLEHARGIFFGLQ
jgi:hypothetical protein